MRKNSAPTAQPVPHVPDAILELKVGGYMVASRSTAGAWWLVFGQTCSCPATIARCHHLRLVSAYCKAQDDARRRPAAKVNVSLMVD